MSQLEISPDPQRAPRPRKSRGPLVFGAAIAVGLAAAGVVLYVLDRDPPPPPPAPAEAVAPAEPPDAGEVEDPEVLAALTQPRMNQDALVRRRVAPLSSSPELQRWLAPDDLVRRFTSSVNNISEGESPRAVLAFLAPQGPFLARETRGERTVIDPASYERYEPITRVLSSFDPASAAGVYRELRPFIRRTYAEIAPPGRTFDQAVTQAIEGLLAVPVLDGDVELAPQAGALYGYADPELEQLTPAQKHLLRMGPANVKRLQKALRAWAQALGLKVNP